MEHVNERGEYNDVPLEEMRATFTRKNSFMFLYSALSGGGSGGPADFDREVELATRRSDSRS